MTWVTGDQEVKDVLSGLSLHNWIFRWVLLSIVIGLLVTEHCVYHRRRLIH